MDLFSIEFLILLTITFVIYYAIGFINSKLKKINIPQWSILLIASLLFYGLANYVYLIYLGFSFAVSYIVGLMTQHKLFRRTDNKENLEYEFKPEKIENHLERRTYENLITAFSIIFNAWILILLKYYNFFVSSVNSVIHTSIATRNFIIPLGISFYVFSLIAYNVDCCKRITIAEKNPFKFLLFVSYFPKVLQGPISSYDQLTKDGLFEKHSFAQNDYLQSFFRISIGLIKKLVIANVVGLYVDATYANISTSPSMVLILVTFLYSIQLYCDFSGFLDISIGVSSLFGIRLEENFNTPYLSVSIQDFWRRWHITLGNWLKKYVYIPLGGNRVPLWRWIINTLIVWLVSGLWHGANWTFVVWGLYHGILIVIFGLFNKLRKHKESSTSNGRAIALRIIDIVFTFLLVNLGWVFFRSSSMAEVLEYLSCIIRFNRSIGYNAFLDSSISGANWLFVVAMVFVVLLIAIVTIYKYPNLLFNRFKNADLARMIATYSITIAFFAFSLFVFLYTKSLGGGESSFIYFDF